MANGERAIQFSARENERENEFKQIWAQELDKVFADVARYYDRANDIASLGLLKWIRKHFIATVELSSRQKVLDVCAGTNIVGISLLRQQPDLEISATDRSQAMQEVGRKQAGEYGLRINSVIADVHRLPFPDDNFDVVTLQYASRHLRIMDVATEIQRVLKPGGHFYHCDMLRPGNKVVERIYYAYLWIVLRLTSWLFDSCPAALNCQKYFIASLRMFYSAQEFSQLLGHLGYEQVSVKTLLGGMVGFHKAVKVRT
jgi:demethylmenaquinone methyltransferase/2-methoxy-6-polyprenyl-1,4-benzoquinol methylase